MRLKIQVWKIGALLLLIAFVLKVLGNQNMILNIQKYIPISIMGLCTMIGFLLVYIYVMVLSTRNVRVFSTISVLFLMLFSSPAVINYGYQYESIGETHVIVEYNLQQGINYFTNDLVRRTEITFYLEESGVFSKRIGGCFDSSNYVCHFIVEEHQIIIYQDDPLDPTRIITFD